MIRLVHRSCDEKMIASVVDALRSGWLAMGPGTASVEGRVCQLLGSRNAIATANCTAALFIVMDTLLEPGDRVLMSPLTFASVASAIMLARGIPVFVDVESNTANIDPAGLTPRLLSEAKAILLSHFAGIPTSVEVTRLAREHGLIVIDDSAHAFGATRHNRPIQQDADVACLSFNSTKVFSCGEGGVIVTNDDDIAYASRLRRNYGMTKTSIEKLTEGPSFDVRLAALNFKFNDILAAVLLPQLEEQRFRQTLERRREVATWLEDRLARTSCRPLSPVLGDVPSWLWRPVVLPEESSPRRSEIVAALRRRGVEVGVHYPLVTTMPFVRETETGKCKTPVATAMASRLLTLPCHEALTRREVDYIVANLSEAEGHCT